MDDSDLPALTETLQAPAKKRYHSKQQKETILELLKAHVFKVHAIEDWDALKEMATYAADPNPVKQIMDEKGVPIFNKDGTPCTIQHIDPLIRQRCLEQIVKYTYPALKAIEMTAANAGGAFTLDYTLQIEEAEDE